MRNDSIRKIKNLKVTFGFYCWLIWLIIFIIGLIGASPYSVDTYHDLETYYTTLIIVGSFLGVIALITIIYLKKQVNIRKEMKKLDSEIDKLKSDGKKLLCSTCLEPLAI